MKNAKIKWLICAMAIGLFVSACGVQSSDHGGARAEAADTIAETTDYSLEEAGTVEAGPDAESLGEAGPDVESTGETEPRANSPGGQQDFDLEMVPAYSGEAYADINDDIPFFADEELTAEPFQEYWPLDEFDRCTGAFACIGPELLPTEERGSTGAATPTGWHSVKYDGIDGGYLYNRCHLIGFQLTGQTVNEKNLITGTRYMNLEGMLPFENSVRMYVEGTGNHVLYRVRPYYKGGNLLAEGVLMEAKSIEDPLVQFCAFCYNVQPGIVIDYATGESYALEAAASGDAASRDAVSGDAAAGDAAAGDKASEKAASDGGEILAIVGDPGVGDGESPARSIGDEPLTGPAEGEAVKGDEAGEDSAEDPVEITYVLNTNTKKFHYPYCKSVKDMKDKNKRETTQSREEIIGQGYQPCKRCNP